MTRRGSGSRLAVQGLTGFIPDSIFSIGWLSMGPHHTSPSHNRIAAAVAIPDPPIHFSADPSPRGARWISYAPCQARLPPLRA
jgi:hypothetical protein